MQLSRARIISAAVDLIEREGVEAVSMRRVAALLDCGVMSLYNHVPSKAALLDDVAERVISGIEFTALPGASWDEQVRAQARAFRAIARKYPRSTMLVVSRPTASLTGLRPIENALATLREAGCGGSEAVLIVRAFIAFIMGSLLREVGVTPDLREDDQGGEAIMTAAAPDPVEFPQVTSLATELSRRDPDGDFEFGLDLLVHAIAALLPATPAT
ncbi:MAG TPA: TetR/AcrR family transcriptional regulator C-terminal domain-containing protein [Streptosporangiaceae bacterium]|jgi:AcrR family transcriptional regulator|nr:TetR/AcrR family transcriptional regulator C-terminal domain-containing protein [Streptosporangiaceae bacterium]